MLLCEEMFLLTEPIIAQAKTLGEMSELVKTFLEPSQSLIAQAESWREVTESVEDALKSVILP